MVDRLVVSSPLPHFIEDDLYAPEEMMEPQSIKYTAENTHHILYDAH